MRGEVSTGRKRNSHPYDWCVDESWVAWQLFVALGGFAREARAGEAIWDPCCGSGRTMVTFADAGFDVRLSDIVNRLDHSQFPWEYMPPFVAADFLELTRAPAPCSIVFNPPYSYLEDIAELCVRHALKLTSRRVCAVLPVKWLGSQGRYALFTEHPPQAVLVLSQRPSMPPGDMIPMLEAAGKAFRGGVVDYAWFVWDVTRPTAPGDTRTVWLPPLHRPDLLQPFEALA
jgi:hypothetical protein